MRVIPRVDSFARKTAVEADSSKRSTSEIQKQNRKRNHDKNNDSCVVKKGDKNATVYDSLYIVLEHLLYVVILVFPYLAYELLRRPIE